MSILLYGTVGQAVSVIQEVGHSSHRRAAGTIGGCEGAGLTETATDLALTHTGWVVLSSWTVPRAGCLSEPQVCISGTAETVAGIGTGGTVPRAGLAGGASPRFGVVGGWASGDTVIVGVQVVHYSC